MTLHDRLTRGLIAGMVAGVVSLLWGLFSFHILKSTRLLYTDFAAILTYGTKAERFWQKYLPSLLSLCILDLEAYYLLFWFHM